MKKLIESFLNLFRRSHEGYNQRSSILSIGQKTSISEPRIKSVQVFSYLGEYEIPKFDTNQNRDIEVRSESNSKLVYKVNLVDLTCTCKSYEHLKTLYSGRHPGILCKHLCKTLISNAQPLGLKRYEISCIELTKDKKVQDKYCLFSYQSGEIIAAFTKDRGWVNICKEDYWGYSPSEQRWAGAEKPKEAGIFQALAKYLLQHATIPRTISIEAENVKPKTSEISSPKRGRWIKTTTVEPGGLKVYFESDTNLTFLNCTSSMIGTLEKEISSSSDSSLELILATFFYKHGVRVKEIEDYYDRYRKKYEERLSDGQHSSEATKFLNIRPFRCCNREMSILNGYDKDRLIEIFTFKDIKTFDKKSLVELLGGNEQFKFNLAFYVARGANSVHKSNSSDHYRPRFQALVKTGLAIQGHAIETKDLLKTLTIKDIRAVLVGSGLKCSTKEEGMTHILGLNNYENKIREHLSEVDDYFKLQPLPFETPVDLRSDVEQSLKYYSSVATITANLTQTISFM